MGIWRTALFGTAILAACRYGRGLIGQPERRPPDGLSAVFATREQADLAIEHLVQQHRVDRSFIFVQPVGEQNSVGTEASGGDHASGENGSRHRSDNPLQGEIEVTVPTDRNNQAMVTRALRDAGARRIATL
jgi:hypothetical protein